MTWGTIFVLALVAGLVYLSIRSIVKDRRAGKRTCGGNCGACSGCGCGSHMSDEEILELARQAAKRNP